MIKEGELHFILQRNLFPSWFSFVKNDLKYTGKSNNIILARFVSSIVNCEIKLSQ